MREIGIYIHIPFCKKKCFYCDFCSYDTIHNLEDEYVSALLKEIHNFEENENIIVKTIYIGGGTPSILKYEEINEILNEIKNKFKLDENAEITIEVNPGTVNAEKLKYYYRIGINRLSIGLQSTNDKLLSLIGRIHKYSDFEHTYEIARAVGFKNINVDLMIGLPTQTLQNVQESLNIIIGKNPEHISVYSLILEENTKLKDLVDEQKLVLPDENLERDMYWLVKNYLKKNGYNQYEISNFSKAGYYSRHNTDCWKQKEYIGFGAAAHSYFNMKRYSNICDVEKYIRNLENKEIEKNVEIHEVQNIESKMNEYMILGLRMIDGVNVKKFKEIFHQDVLEKYKKQLEKLQKEKLIYFDNEKIYLTNKGIDFANIVWEEFV